MHDLLFHNQNTLHPERLNAYARPLGLDAAAFDHCLAEGKYAAKVHKDVEEGTIAGIQGTPAFFLGKTSADGLIQGVAIRGAQPIEAFRHVIERLQDGR
jgi:predicted DsbA family dithiol-disulfide isomerase